MREIKFRGYSLLYKEWIEGEGAYYDKQLDKMYIIYFDNVWQEAEVIKESLGQYTGLKDTNGKDIFEGDIIKVIRKHWNNCGKEYLEKITEEIGEVVFYKNWEISLKTKEKEGTLYQPFLWMFEDEEDYEVEIIGNLYENKDLLND